MQSRANDIETVLSRGRPQYRWVWLSFVFAAIFLTLAGLWYWRTGPGAMNETQYVTNDLDRGDIVVMVTATGSVEPTNKVEISSELSGTVRSVSFDFNDTVKTGDALACLDTDTLQANLARARANVSVAEARIVEVQVTLDETQKTYERATLLEEKGLSSNQAWLAAKATFDRTAASLSSAEANLAIANADLKLSEATLAKACLYSPIDGIVLERNVEVGQIVAASFSAPVLFTLAQDLSRMQLQVDIDEADIGRVNAGDAAVFTVEAYQNTTFPAAISELRYAPLTVNGVVTYKAILAIDNTKLLLRPGMTATADIIVSETRDVLRVPNAALRFTPPPSLAPPTSPSEQPIAEGKRTIWVLRNDLARPIPVTTGMTDGTYTEIVAGDLEEGDSVIVDISTG